MRGKAERKREIEGLGEKEIKGEHYSSFQLFKRLP